MEVLVMVMEAGINIQEDKIVAMEVAEWALDMIAVQTMDITVVRILDMAAVDVVNLQEADMVVVQIGDLDLEVLAVEVGDLAAMKVAQVIVDILKINISVEGKTAQAAMTMIIAVPEETVPVQEEVDQVLLADVADAVAQGINFRNTFINDKRMKNQKTGETNGSTNGTKETSHKTSLLEKFFTDQLKDMYYAEQQLIKALPEMQKAATSEELEDAFDAHLKQTERHVKRLEKVFRLIGKNPEGKKCEAMQGLIKEAKSIISETKEESMTRDAALIIAAQKIEHYEIASYGGLVQLAITMDLHRAAELLDKTLQEEENTDSILTQIAETSINVQAENEGAYSWQQQETMMDA